jgi:hypothetical protein
MTKNSISLAEKFTKETGISTWDNVKKSGESGKWLVVSLWEPKERGGKNPGLSIELTKGVSREHFTVMDDNGELSNFAKNLLKD